MAKKPQPPATDTLDGVVERNKTKPIGAEREIAARQKTNAAQTIKEIQIQGTLQQFASVSVAMNESLAQLSSRLLASSQELTKLLEAIDVKQEELQTLYDKEVVARELDQLLAHYEAQQLALASEMKLARQQWQEEGLAQGRQRTQEEEAFGYQRDRNRRANEDTWQAQLMNAQRAEEVRKDELGRHWARREEEIATRAKGFDEELAKLKSSQEAQIAAITRNLATEAKLVQAEATGRLALVQQELASLKALLVSRDAEVVELRAARAVSETHVRDIAMRGLDTASTKLQWAEGALVNRGGEATSASPRKPS